MTTDKTSILRRQLEAQEIQVTHLADGTSVLLDLSGHQVLSLNKTGTLLTQLVMSENSSEEELAKELAARYGVSEEQAFEDCAEFLAKLSAAVGS